METHPKIREHMSQKGKISRAAHKIAQRLNYIKIAKAEFSQIIKNSIESNEERIYLIALFNLLIVYCHGDKL